MPTLHSQLEASNRATLAAAGPRYSPGLDPSAPNLEVEPLVEAVSSLALATRGRARAQEVAAELRSAAQDGDHTVQRLLTGIRSTPTGVADDLEHLAGLRDVADVRTGARSCHRRAVALRRCIERRQQAVDDEIRANRTDPEVPPDEPERRLQAALQSRARDLQNLWSAVLNVEEWLTGPEGRLLTNTSCVLLRGPWGSGKTHFVCDFAIAAAEDGVPALVVLASSLRDDLPPLDAVSAATGIGSDGHDLAGKLDRAGKRAGRRALIMIDAINEADRAAWRARLPGLVRDVRRYENLGLVLTCRTPFDRMIVGDATSDPSMVVLHHPGFERQEFDAQQEFFAHYGLPAPHVPLITPEFSRPLFLRVLCEAFARLSRSSQHRQLRDIASGQKGMTYVLEYFAKAVGSRVEAPHALPSLTCWKLMKGQPARGHAGLAGRMARERRDYLWPVEVIEELQSQTGLAEPNAVSVARAMVSEGLLVEDMRYVDGEYRSVLSLPYQRFADHLIARHLLDQHLDTTSETALRRCLYINRPLGAIFEVEPWGRQYAEPGLAAAVMLEFPERVRRRGFRPELIQYLPAERRLVAPFTTTFLDGLYWRDSTAFTDDTTRVVDRLLALGDPSVTADVYETLIGLAARPAHPLNAQTLWRRLGTLSMRERDLGWSEALRVAGETSNVRRLIAWAGHPSRSSTSHDVALNEMRVLALALTTTHRELRDRCTLALVQLGEAQPAPMFELALEALQFNDPYVSERVLAACYGVCMRRWALESPRSEFANDLINFAPKIAHEVLQPVGRHFTWHALTRGYVIGIVNMARKIRPRSVPIGDPETLVTSPESAPSPFRDARRIRPRDTVDGRHAIHMDFGNYTMGRLVTGRQNYDMQHVGYKRVRRQIEDRIRRLGYSKDEFAERDQRIGQDSWRDRGVAKVDRYGKKYSWIAYFEMYGLRDGLKLLDDYWISRERTSDCDVDPSFPAPLSVWTVPLDDHFSAAPADHASWLSGGTDPEYTRILDRSDVDDVPGDWLLLDASLREHGPDGRELMSWVASLMATPANVMRLRAEFESGRALGDRGIPEGGTDHYTYLGEVPWSRHYGSDVRTSRGKARRTTGRAFDYFSGGRWRPGIPVEVTARTWGWESYHSELNQLGSVEFPAPALAEFLDLRSIGGSADLVDPSGQPATLFRVSSNEGLRSHVLYIRRDLLNSYLDHRGFQLVRSVWGERTLAYEFMDRDLPDELRNEFIRHSNSFRFADFGEGMIRLGPPAG